MLDKRATIAYIIGRQAKMIKMKKEPRFRVNWQAQQSYAGAFDDRYIVGNLFVSRDGWHYCRLSISRYSKNRPMDIVHELGHLLGCRGEYLAKKDPWSDIRREIRAWRIAKSICKPEYWREQDALESIVSHLEGMDNAKKLRRRIYRHGWGQIKIVPLNAGVSLK